MIDSKQIVLIDPAADATAALAGRLRMQGYAVTSSHDPEDGARLALTDPPSAIVADLWMPGISGVQLCRLLKAEPATEHVPVILRGPDGARNRFWSERAGASAYVVKGRMGDLVRALALAIASTPATDGFFTTLAPGEHNVRERIAAHLDAALFESVLAADVRALGTCEAFDRLFDLFSQFVSRVTSYRWLAVSTNQPPRLGLHTTSHRRDAAEREARNALGIDPGTLAIAVEDDDASDDEEGPAPIVRPICLGGIAIGQLALATRHPEHTLDIDFAAIIAREIAGPIRMATLVEESQRLATIDALTGLMNRRAFTAALDVEVARAARYAHPLSFVLLDIDHFKAVNDRRGHQGGDAVLASVGHLLWTQARKTDIVGRWGGEEFVIALTSTDEAGGLIVAERARAAVEHLDVRDAGGTPIPVTASFGLVSYERGESLEALTDRADRAMYAAKSSGRNRVVVGARAGPCADPVRAAESAA